MTRRRDPGRTRPPLPDTLPDRDAVERALEIALDRLQPKPSGAKAARPKPPGIKPAGSDPAGVGPGRKTRPDGAGT
ncbi:hypothetical protein ABIE45_004204 [Methylobacterium sp. OAE515]